MSNINSSNQESNPQKESNEDKGKHDLYKNTEPQKKPNTEPDNSSKIRTHRKIMT